MIGFLSFFKNPEIALHAGHLSFMTLISIIPFVAVGLITSTFLANFGLIAEDLFISIIENFARSIGASDKILQYINQLIKEVNFEAVGLFGYLFLILTSYRLMWSVHTSFNAIWETPKKNEKRRHIITVFAVIFGIPLYSILCGLVSYISKEVFVIEYFVMASIPFILIAIYKIIPRSKVDTKAAIYAALTTSVALVIMRVGFNWSSATLMGYNKIYGSLAYLPLFMVLIYLEWMLVLYGVEISRFLSSRKTFSFKSP